MTFKHVKFEDSPVMRSLEKVAKEKGMVKEEPIVKKAEQKQDLLPTYNFDLNLAKLCDGLRKAGMDKHADELETNFVNYKRAQTLYEAHTEKGEDLINAAHPKGSHHLEGVEGEEATVEDILDQHLKIIDKINKMPTGKLASLDAIRAVKTVLADGNAQKFPPELIANWFRVSTIQKIENAYRTASAGLDVVQRAVRAGHVEQSRTFGKDFEDIAHEIQGVNNEWHKMYIGDGGGRSNPNAPGIQAMIEHINNANMYLNEAFDKGTGDDMKAAAQAKFTQAVAQLQGCIATVQAFAADPESLPPGVTPPAAYYDAEKQKQQASNAASLKNQLTARYNNAVRKLTYYQGRHFENLVPPANKAKITGYLDRIKGILDNVNTALSGAKADEDLSSIQTDLTRDLASAETMLTTFETQVVNHAPTGM